MCRKAYDIKLSSAGLVFKHFGEQVVTAICGPLEEKSLAAILAKTYDGLIRALATTVGTCENRAR